MCETFQPFPTYTHIKRKRHHKRWYLRKGNSSPVLSSPPYNSQLGCKQCPAIQLPHTQLSYFPHTQCDILASVISAIGYIYLWERPPFWQHHMTYSYCGYFYVSSVKGSPLVGPDLLSVVLLSLLYKISVTVSALECLFNQTDLWWCRVGTSELMYTYSYQD